MLKCAVFSFKKPVSFFFCINNCISGEEEFIQPYLSDMGKPSVTRVDNVGQTDVLV